MALETEVCVNCNLHTPITQWRCIHCGKNRQLKTDPKIQGHAHDAGFGRVGKQYPVVKQKEVVQ